MTRGKFRHFRFSNIVIRDTYRSAITIASVDGATIEDVVVDGLRAEHTGNPIFLRLGERRTGKGEPCLKDITLRNIYVEVPLEKPDAGYSYEGPVEDLPRNISPSSIVGTPQHRIQNVLLENVELVYPGHADSAYAYCGTAPEALAAIPEWERRYPEFSMWKELPAWGFYLRHADNITLRNVTLRVGEKDYRPAIVADDVENLVLDHMGGFGFRQAAGGGQQLPTPEVGQEGFAGATAKVENKGDVGPRADLFGRHFGQGQCLAVYRRGNPV